MTKFSPIAGTLVVLSLAARAMTPLEGDRIIHEGTCAVADGGWSRAFTLRADEKPLGLFLDVEGIEEFDVLVNGAPVKHVTRGRTPRTRVRTVDLSEGARLLQPGRNVIAVVPGEEATGFWARAWTSDRAWYLSSFHAHTTYSDGQYSVHDLLQQVLGEGGRFYAITDHETLGQCHDTAFHQVGDLVPIRGYEWTTDSGHANLLGIEGGSTVPHGPIAGMIDEASYRGALVQVNHPTDLTMEWLRCPLLDPGIDMIEVFNSLSWFPPGGTDSDADAVAWWQELLVAGRTVAGVGNSDYHGTLPGEEPLKSCTRVFSHAAHPDTVLKCAKLGLGMICDAPDDSRLYLYADTNDNGQWDLVMGEHARIPSGSRTIRFRLEVEDADWTDVVYVYDRSGEAFSHTLWTGGDYEREWSETFSSTDRDFVRVELLAEFGIDYETCTNPIYVNHPDYELGPTEFATAAAAWPDTLYVGQEDTLRLLLRNAGGYSPYRFGLVAACDTALFDITGWQESGAGIGEVTHRVVDGHEVVEWRGGYEWGNRLAAGDTFGYWLTVAPRSPGVHPVLFRSRADDRLFVVEKDPESGVPGPEDEQFHAEEVLVEVVTGIAGSLRTTGRTSVLGVAPVPASGGIEVALRVVPTDPVRDIAVHDASGRRVATLPVPGCKSGTAQVHWDGTGSSGRRLAPGPYFLRVASARGSHLARVVLTR